MKTVPFDSLFQEELQDADAAFIPGYLNAAYIEGGIPVFLSALKKVIQANQGMTKASSNAGVARESLYRSLSETGNPHIETIDSLLKSLGVRIEFVPTQSVLPNVEDAKDL